MAQILSAAGGLLARRRKAILLLRGVGVLAVLTTWCGTGCSPGHAAQATNKTKEIEKVLSDHASSITQITNLGQILSNSSGPLAKVAALGPAIKDINAIRARTVKIGVGNLSRDVNVWAMICKVSFKAYILDAGVNDLAFVVDSSQNLLDYCQLYEASRLHFEQAMEAVRHDPSDGNFAKLTDAATQFRNSVDGVNSHLATLDGKLASVHTALTTSRDLLAKIDIGPVSDSAHSLATTLELPIHVTETASGQVAMYHAGLEDAMKALDDISQKAAEH